MSEHEAMMSSNAEEFASGRTMCAGCLRERARAGALLAAGNALAAAYAEARNLARCEAAPCDQCKHVGCTSYAPVKAWKEATK